MKLTVRIGLSVAAAAALAAPAVGQDPAAAGGEKLYADNCQACHQKAGAGVTGAFPPLASSPFVQGDAELLTVTVLNGRGGMPAYKSELTDDQLAQILTFMRASWGNQSAPVTPTQVTEFRAKAEAAAQPKDLLAH